MLERAGLTPQDVTLRFLGPVDGRAALTSGAVAARAPWEPYIATSTAIDGTVRVPDGGVKALCLVTPTHWPCNEALQDAGKREAIADLLARLAKAQIWAQHHPQEFAGVLSKTLNMPTAITRSWIDDARIRPLVFDTQLIATLQKSADFFHRYQVLPKQVDVSRV